MSMFNTFKVHPQDRVRREGSFQQFNLEGPKQQPLGPPLGYQQDYQQGTGSGPPLGPSPPGPPRGPYLVSVPFPQKEQAFIIPTITVDQHQEIGQRRGRSHSLPTMEPSLNKVQSCTPRSGSDMDQYPQRGHPSPNGIHPVLAPLQTGFAQAPAGYAAITECASTPHYEYGMSWHSPHSSYTASPISPPWCG